MTKKITEKFHNDCKNLFCLQPNKEPKATDHVEDMISMIKKLVEKKVLMRIKDTFILQYRHLKNMEIYQTKK